jgi:hypothetical protein
MKFGLRLSASRWVMSLTQHHEVQVRWNALAMSTKWARLDVRGNSRGG